MTAADLVEAAVREALADVTRRPLVIGVCGAQGSGKSTVSAAVVEALTASGIPAATLSLDDLYLPRADRLHLAATVHPLLATRGVPGTHDTALGLALLAALDRGAAVRLPRFDKASDDRAPEDYWTPIAPVLDVLIFEGWCVGAIPQSAADLGAPVNPLERDDDPDGRWRAYVNASLAGPGYRALFARIDRLILLAAPGFEVVRDWRIEQERRGVAIMTDAEVARFVAHYERLTRHVLAEMPDRADVVIRLAPDRSVSFA
ncbi:kinase [Polymorphobacter sp. PAMC 29334]|uniref:kinase n=1 Tax=Polymorphobacter sp. PAMC 29334 TaxID=2862331 RepID=UPI001C74F4E2|nr:kinase [Polymorphobacter sp. PAMC 29334]QYE34628.1 kinase [Polymorphobacter sp. PAMC 29334]